jgi:aminopeptidase N
METQKEDTNKYPLTLEDAIFRKNELISDNNEYFIHYDLLLTLRKSTDLFNSQLNTNQNNSKNSFTPKDFEGRVKAIFNYHPKTDKDLFLNYHGQVNSVIINGIPTEVNHKNRRIFLKKADLKTGKNEVVILFSSSYSHGGLGLHQFVDPADKKEYLYTQFEPFECNTVFPVFDQPDLKATLNMSLCGHKEWILLSNELDILNKDLIDIYPANKISLSVSDKEDFEKNFQEFLELNEEERNFLFNSVSEKDYKITAFNKTDKISSYLFALCAGPFYCHLDTSNYKVPLRIFMRESLKDCGNPEEFFKITIAGMEWYHKFFGYPYPFRKYDQIYCPEYNFGAMENVGLVTYNEMYCWRENPTNQLRNKFSITVLHELAHMWFGNFVTMKWWDDLWLNESFATFISFLCQDQALTIEKFGDTYQNSWLTFNTYKDFAYKEDQNSNTHSVYSEINDTEQAHSNFDMIVYYKGSSLLKQMFYFIQEKNFSEGLYSYFTKFKWNNSVFDNFIDEMADAVSKRDDEDKLRKSFDLKNLSKKWLTEPGLNQIELNMKTKIDESSSLSSSPNKISEFIIKQNPCLEKFANLQTHLMDILFIYENSPSVEIKDVLIENMPCTNIAKVIGMDAPSAVILNYNDYAYIKWIIDENSFNFLRKNLHNKLDLLSRKLVYRSLYDSMRDAKISSIEYIETLCEFLKSENDESLVINNLTFLSSAVLYFTPRKYQNYFYEKLWDLVSFLIKEFIEKNKSYNGLIPILISFSVNEKHIKIMQKWLDSNEDAFLLVNNETFIVGRNNITQDHRFSILSKVFQLRDLDFETKMKLLEVEKERDKNSDKSRKAEITCKACLPTIQNKQEVWDQLVNFPNSDSLHNKRALMIGFAPINQIDLIEEFLTEKFFDAISSLGKCEYFYIDYFLMFCSPTNFVDQKIIEKFEQKISTLDSTFNYIKKALIEMLDEIKRYQRAQAFTELKASLMNRWNEQN